MELLELADRVNDERSFIQFLAALAADYADEAAKEKAPSNAPYGPGPNGWEHQTIDGFLDAAADWAASSVDGLTHYTKPNNPWQRCADILLMGKIYE